MRRLVVIRLISESLNKEIYNLKTELSSLKFIQAPSKVSQAEKLIPESVKKQLDERMTELGYHKEKIIKLENQVQKLKEDRVSNIPIKLD